MRHRETLLFFPYRTRLGCVRVYGAVRPLSLLDGAAVHAADQNKVRVGEGGERKRGATINREGGQIVWNDLSSSLMSLSCVSGQRAREVPDRLVLTLPTPVCASLSFRILSPPLSTLLIAYCDDECFTFFFFYC